MNKQTTVPILSSLSALRCERGDSKSNAAWLLKVPRNTLDREQLDSGARSRNGSRSSKRPEPFIYIDFAQSRSRNANSRSNPRNIPAGAPITVLVRAKRAGDFAYFTDAKGQYLLGLGGKKLYALARGLLQTLDQNGPQFCLALDANAYPPELRQKLAEYYQSLTRDVSSPRQGLPTIDPMLRAPGPAPIPRTPSSTSAKLTSTHIGPFTETDAAAWLARLSANYSTSADTDMPSRRPASKRVGKDLSLLNGRWLFFHGNIIAKFNGRIRNLAQDEFAQPAMFYSTEEASALLGNVEEYYQASLQSWPTLAGQLHRHDVNARLSSMIGLRAERSTRATDLSGIDLKNASWRAEKLLAANDLNQAIAIYTDLTGLLSLRLRLAISQDVLSDIDNRWATENGTSTQSEPGLFPEEIDSAVANQVRHLGFAPPKTRRSRKSKQPADTLSQAEQFFLDADLLVQASVQKAHALRKADFPQMARRTLLQSNLRLRAYLLTDIADYVDHLQTTRAAVPQELQSIRQGWLAMSDDALMPGLIQAIQIAQSTLDENASSANTTQEPLSPAMTLANWLQNPTSVTADHDGESLLIAGQFSWLRDLMSLEPTDPAGQISAAEQARQIITLAKAYSPSAQPESATAMALWQLGSFMMATGNTSQACDCLALSASVYSQLAASALDSPESELALTRTQSRYFAYRVAALSVLAQTLPVTAESPLASRSSSALLAAEIQARLLSLQKAWNGLSITDERTQALISASARALALVRELCQARAYDQPNMRFWWWCYPRQDVSAVAKIPASSSKRRRKSSARSSQPAQRVKLEYIQTVPQPGKGRKSPRNMPTQPAQPLLPPIPGSRLGI